MGGRTPQKDKGEVVKLDMVPKQNNYLVIIFLKVILGIILK